MSCNCVFLYYTTIGIKKKYYGLAANIFMDQFASISS